MSSLPHMAIPSKAVDHITKILASDLGPLQTWKSIKDMLLDCGVAYVTTAKATAFVVHPKNRGGALISPHGCHRKGFQIMKAGADISLLGNSVCMELCYAQFDALLLLITLVKSLLSCRLNLSMLLLEH